MTNQFKVSESPYGTLNCPFCGTQPRIYKSKHDDYSDQVSVACGGCNASTNPVIYQVPIKEAVEAWNKITLKLCPFCHSIGVLHLYNNENYTEHYVYVKCTNSSCAAQGCRVDVMHVEDLHAMSKKAIDAWNKRPCY